MKDHFLCLGIRRAGITTITYVENGKVVKKSASSLQNLCRSQLPKGANSHG